MCYNLKINKRDLAFGESAMKARGGRPAKIAGIKCTTLMAGVAVSALPAPARVVPHSAVAGSRPLLDFTL